jgi:Flp pilus assembly protein TadG
MRAPLFDNRRTRFHQDERGSVAIILGLAILPMMLAAGIAADYAIQQSVKTRLDASADAAALAAIKSAQTTIARLSQTNPDPNPRAIKDALAQANKSFNAQAGRFGGHLLEAPKIQVAIKDQTVSANVSYRAAIATNFGKLAGVPTLGLAGSATAELTMAKFLDFYLLLDVSGSMGLPSTAAGQTALAKKNPDEIAIYPSGCIFACHFPGSQGYTVARANNIQLRVDAVGGAVAKLMETARDTKSIPDQFRVGVYPFVNHANTFVDLTSDLTGDQYSVATAINYDAVTKSTDFGKLLDAGDDKVFASSLNPNYKKTSSAPADVVPMGAGGTHFENIFNEINAKVMTVGNGAGALSAQPFVFLVSDGMQDSQMYLTSTGKWPGVTPYPTPPGQKPSIRAMDPASCGVLKQRGITVAVLYIPYTPILDPKTFANSQDFKANDAIPNLEGAMKACASTDFYWTANTPDDIADAMQKMFAQAMQSARLTQ